MRISTAECRIEQEGVCQASSLFYSFKVFEITFILLFIILLISVCSHAGIEVREQPAGS